MLVEVTRNPPREKAPSRLCISIAHRNLAAMRLPRFAELERRRRARSHSHRGAKFATAGTNNCIRDCDSRHRRRQVLRPCASEMRFRRVLARGRRERKGEKVTTERRRGRPRLRVEAPWGERKERYKTVESTRVLAPRHGRQARGNLRCAANVSLPGSVHRQLPNFE